MPIPKKSFCRGPHKIDLVHFLATLLLVKISPTKKIICMMLESWSLQFVKIINADFLPEDFLVCYKIA